MKQFLLVCALVLVAPVSSSGCAAVQKVVDLLPTVIQYVQDANLILDTIDRAVVPLLELQQDQELGRRYAEAMDAARQSLQIALRSAEGGKQLSDKELDAAFANFRQAYLQLQELLQRAGLMNSTGTLSAAPGMVRVTVETPLAMRTGS